MNRREVLAAFLGVPFALSACRRDEVPPQVYSGKWRQREQQAAKPILDPSPPETPQRALARIEIPQDVVERISELMVAGSALIVSDHDLGEETGKGTDFIVVTR